MSLTTDDIRDAAFLSNAAYDQGIHAQAFLGTHRSPSGAIWQWVNPAAFGAWSFSIDHHGYFDISVPLLVDAQALLAYNSSTNTLAIVFRGTEKTHPTDFVNDGAGFLGDFGLVYQGFPGLPSLHGLVSDVLGQATTFGATRVLIAGHSLGGAMAEEAMAQNLADARLAGVTFGSPGTGGINNPGYDDRLINIGHVDPHLQGHLLSQGDPVFRSALHKGILGSDIRIDLPDKSVGLGQHGMSQYIDTAKSIANEIDKNAIDSHPFDVRAFSYVLGTDPAKAFLNGTSSANVIIGDSGTDIIRGDSGNDILDGGDGNDVLDGGFGNDVIYGGNGTDTVIFSYAHDEYNVSMQGNSVIIAPKIGAPQYDGTDTINKIDVEIFQFSDATYTLAQLLPPPDNSPPMLTGKLPADNQTSVPIGLNIVLRFNEAVIKGSSGNIDIHNADGSLFQRIAITDPSVACSGSTVTIDPSFNFRPSAGYYITIDSGAIYDQAGNAFAGIFSHTDFNFSTAAAADTSAPMLSRTSPSDNANGVAIGADIQLSFNELILPGSGNIDIHKSDGTLFQSISVLDASRVSFSHNTVTINPSTDFVSGSGYYVTIAPGAIRDLAGNLHTGLSSNAELDFTTQSAPYLPPAHDTGSFLSIVDNTVREGSNGTTILSFGVNLSGAGAGTQTVSVQYATQDIANSAASAIAGQDYVLSSNVLVIPAGQTFGHIDVTVLGDTNLELDEVFRLVLSQPSLGVTLLDSAGQPSNSIFASGFISNDDQAPNHRPITGHDLAITSPNTPILMDVLANDTDIDGNILHVDGIFHMSPGATYALMGDQVLITPEPDFTGVLEFQYVVRDTPTTLSNSTFLSQVIVAGDGSPGISNSGTIDNDIIVGTGGNDSLAGGFGDDIIAGGPGADRIDGGAGFDSLDLRQAEHGADIHFRDPWTFADGDGGQDALTNIEGVLGGRLDDKIDGSSADIQYITTGYRFNGNDGNDRLQSDAGDDVLDGGNGNDELIFGAGHDIVYGGVGNDEIYSFNGNSDALGDVLDGGPGDDKVSGSLGRSPDVLTGGMGDDQIQFSDGDIVSGDEGRDAFLFGGFSAGSVYHGTITDLKPGEKIEWTVPTPLPDGSSFAGIHFGSGETTGLDEVEYAVVDGQTNLYFGYDSILGADFVLSVTGVFALNQFKIDSFTFRPTLRVVGGAADDIYTGHADEVLFVDAAEGVLANDLNAVALAASLASPPDHGTVRLNADGSFSYTPDSGFTGVDHFTYNAVDDSAVFDTAEVAISIESRAPHAVDDSGQLIPFNTPTVFTAANLLTNDSDPDQDELTLVSVSDAAHGTVSLDAQGDPVFTAAGNYSGLASFHYAVSDGVLTSTASVLFAVEAPGEVMITGPGDDILAGGVGNDRLAGGDGADSLFGAGGNDWMSGGSGGDSLNGGVGGDVLWGAAGNDIYYVDNANDVVIEGRNGGTDEIHSAISYQLGSYVENLVLEGEANGTGNKFDNRLIGSDSANVLNGLIGQDYLEGGGGDDTLTGGRDCDTFAFKSGFGQDTITDFAVSGAYSFIGPNHDVLEFDSNIFVDTAALFAHSADTPDGVLITNQAADTLLIENTTLQKLQAHPEDFHFV